MAVVGCHERDARLTRQTHKLGKNTLLLLDAVVLQLDKEIPRPENPAVVQRRILGARIVSGCQVALHPAGQAGRKRDQPAGILRKQLVVHTRLAIKAFGESQ